MIRNGIESFATQFQNGIVFCHRVAKKGNSIDKIVDIVMCVYEEDSLAYASQDNVARSNLGRTRDLIF